MNDDEWRDVVKGARSTDKDFGSLSPSTQRGVIRREKRGARGRIRTWVEAGLVAVLANDPDRRSFEQWLIDEGCMTAEGEEA